ncbi:hypothetical protein K1719_046063 [Acacia pycnantha]|nr:hypothetical protein K1719_046063 [Acacia pycnantha]
MCEIEKILLKAFNYHKIGENVVKFGTLILTKHSTNISGGIDHHAPVIDRCFGEVKAPRSFKFEAYWVEHDDFLHIVEKGWNEVVGIAEDKVLDLIQRLDACRRRLIEWNRREFPNFRKVIDLLKKESSLCYAGKLNAKKLVEAEALVKQIEEAWDKEEVYWWRRSRISG